MMPLGLSAADYAGYMSTLARSHEFKVKVQVLRASDHAVMTTISHLMLDGQIDCEAAEGDSSDVAHSRTAILRFLDPKRTLVLEAGSPNDGAVYFDRMLRVIYSVYTGRAANGGWVDVTVMTGPVVNLQRLGNEVLIEAHGKEEYGLSHVFKTAKYAKGTRKVVVMRNLLAIMGETNAYMRSIPTGGGERNPRPVTITGQQKVWPVVFSLAKGLTKGGKPWRVYYDGRGHVILQPISRPVAFKMAGGNGGFLLSDPQINYNMADVKNVVKVIGRKVAGQEAVVHGVAVAPATHPLSPNKLGRNGKPRYYLHLIDNPQVIGQAAATALAKSQLAYWLNQRVQASWECLPVPHMDPWDTVQLVTDRGSLNAPVRRFTLPLVAGAPMSVGATRNVLRPKRSA